MIHDFPSPVCPRWTTWLFYETVVSDLLIFVSYCVISLMLISIYRQLTFHFRLNKNLFSLFLWFGLFTLGCGATHLLNFLTIYFPWFYSAAHAKLFAASVSMVVVWTLKSKMPLLLHAPVLLKVEGIDLAAMAKRVEQLAEKYPEKKGRSMLRGLS